MNNNDLKNIYEDVYKKGKENFFTFNTLDITKNIIKEINYEGLEVLEIGCGEGDTAFEISQLNAKMVSACDYSESAINVAISKHKKKNNLKFFVKSIDEIEGEYDCIILQEVIEHTDNPKSSISKLLDHIRHGGHLILTCPSFLNMRGYVWMTLQLLFEVRMSLTDKQFISPFDMEKWAKECGASITWYTFRHEQAYGPNMIFDMKKRLTNALRDAKMNNENVDELLDWLALASIYEKDNNSNGAKALYHIIKK